jgi:transposase InsO family protein
MRESIQVSTTALERYEVVSAILSRRLSGMSLPAAIAETLSVCRAAGRPARVPSKRSCYRWLAAYESEGLAGLEPQERDKALVSIALGSDLVEFLEREKRDDPAASIPEILRRGRITGVIGDAETVSRTTVWREAKRRGLDCRRPLRTEVKRRFAFENRLLMVIGDGKHFRAGPQRRKRVALVLLDDATRYALGVRVTTSENTVDFLHLVHETIHHYGLFVSCYLDHGPGFASHDTATVLARLGILLILGAVRYPEGHGKIERLNRTMKAAVLRGLDGNPTVDDDPRSLTLRLKHWLTEIYNHTPHEGLGGDTPHARWHGCSRPLDFPGRDFARHFVVTHKRRVSADNIVRVDGVDHEMPAGHAGRKVEIMVDLLGDTVSVVHEERSVTLHPVDRAANARERRHRRTAADSDDEPTGVATAADHAFSYDTEPLTDPDGGYTETETDERNPDEPTNDDD